MYEYPESKPVQEVAAGLINYWKLHFLSIVRISYAPISIASIVLTSSSCVYRSLFYHMYYIKYCSKHRNTDRSIVIC